MNLYVIIIFILVFLFPISLFLGNPADSKSIAYLFKELIEKKLKTKKKEKRNTRY